MVAPCPLPSTRLLRRTFSYDRETGVLAWAVSPHPRIGVGATVGCINKHGYRHLLWKRRDLLAHRIIWKMVTGKDPIGIDHINGNPSDNRWCNLREATTAQNAHNKKRPATNTSGYKGVTFIPAHKKWQAGIEMNGKAKHLGWFLDPKDAHAAYCAAAIKLFGKFARTS